MPSLAELRIKITSIKSTQQITKAMKMIASVRLAQSQKKVLAARTYLSRQQRLGYYLKSEFFENNNSLLEGNKSDVIGILVVVGDKGLCGSFNNNVLNTVYKFIQANSGKNFKIFVIGRKAVDFFPRMSIAIEKEYSNIFGSLDFSVAKNISKDILKCFLENNLSSFVVFYNESKSIIKQKVVQSNILPISFEKKDENKIVGSCIFEPHNKFLLDSFLISYLEAFVYKVLYESYSSELAARMTAMDNASKNAQDLIDNLTLIMNNVRQAGITKELSEIVGASEALK